jgi:hypothetical protein
MWVGNWYIDSFTGSFIVLALITLVLVAPMIADDFFRERRNRHS